MKKIFKDKDTPSRKEDNEPTKDTRADNQFVKKTISTLKAINYIYRQVSGMDHKCKLIIPGKDGILAVSSIGLFYIEDNKASLISDNKAINALLAIDENNYIICAENGVFPLMHSKGKWFVGEQIGGIVEASNSVVLFDSSQIWVGSNNGAYKIEGSLPITMEGEGRGLKIKEYHIQNDFSVSVFVDYVNDTLMAFSEMGIFYYSPDADSFKNYSNKELGLQASHKYKYILSEGNCPMVKIKGRWKCMNRSFENKVTAESLFSLFDDLEMIRVDDKISDMAGISKESVFALDITKVSGGNKNYFDLSNLEFDSDEKAIYVKVRAPDYHKKTSTKYQYLVEGLMSSWSAWNANPDINLFLESGKYKIRIRAMNILGEISDEKTINISVKQPFTKSGWFYLFIVVAFIGLFIIVSRARELKLIHDKKILEEKVRLRTIEIQKKKEQIEIQRDEIFKQKEEITDSIEYASRIQTAMFSDKKIFEKNFKEHFILFKPKDIVSGDYYWIEELGDKVYFAAADCTGHGVPGALMSMLGISFLNEIVNTVKKDGSAAKILELLREKIILSISSSGEKHAPSDGLDIALCIFDKNKKTINYSGAYNPLYHFSKGGLIEYKGDRMPIGSYPVSKNFTNHELKPKKGDVIYIFSDGYADQFGGPKDKKFSCQRLKAELAEIVKLSMDKQHENLDRKFKLWKGRNLQLDDIVLIGVKF